MYLYYDSDNQIRMISEKKIIAPNFSYIQKKLTNDELIKLQDINYEKKIVDKKLKLLIS